MHLNEARLVQRLRTPMLSHSLRGFDESETRRLLQEAATALDQAYKDRDEARAETHIAAKKAAEESTEAEAIGRALLTATSTGEQIVAAAKDQAEQLLAEAAAQADTIRAEAVEARDQLERHAANERAELQREREAERRRLAADRQELLAHTRAEADRLKADARAEVARVRNEAEELAVFLESKRAAFAEMTSAALERLDHIDAGAFTDLAADLHPGSRG